MPAQSLISWKARSLGDLYLKAPVRDKGVFEMVMAQLCQRSQDTALKNDLSTHHIYSTNVLHFFFFFFLNAGFWGCRPSKRVGEWTDVGPKPTWRRWTVRTRTGRLLSPLKSLSLTLSFLPRSLSLRWGQAGAAGEADGWRHRGDGEEATHVPQASPALGRARPQSGEATCGGCHSHFFRIGV